MACSRVRRMWAGIFDHVWTYEEIASLLDQAAILMCVAVLREPSDGERRLLLYLAQTGQMPTEWLGTLMVAEMDDGGMGSLRLAPEGVDKPGRLFGASVAEFSFDDADGVKVWAALYVDKDGTPLEFDMWKVDFSPLVRIPELQPKTEGSN